MFEIGKIFESMPLSSKITPKVYFYLLVMLTLKLGYGKQNFTTCNYKFSEDSKNVTFIGKNQNTSSQNFIAYISLCDNIPSDYCGEEMKICIKKKSDNAFFLFGYELQPAYLNSNVTLKKDALYVNKLAAPHCTDQQQTPQIVVRFICDDDTKDEPKLIVIDQCNFELHLLHPTCTPKCTTRTHYNLIDLRPIMKVYHVNNDIGYFSLGICKSNTDCDASNSVSCLITKNNTIPLSGALDNLQYYENESIMKIRGKYKGQRRSLDKVVEIKIKCDWTKLEPVLYFLKTPNQKTFRFEMLTSYGCVKFDAVSKIKHGLFLFDFESLYKRNDYWKINLASGEEILLNIFGPLILPDDDNICSKTNAQVCLKNGNQYINLGSIQTPPKTDNDIISIRITSGAICLNGQQENLEHTVQQHETIIEFICGMDEKGPQLNARDKCETYLSWETPQACPKYDKTACKHKHISDQSCLLDIDNNFFNLTNLYKKNDKYVIEDQKKGIEYILNMCGPVDDEDVPCNDNNIIYLKQVNEHNLNRRLTSLGKIKDFYYKNGQLVLETSSGGLCYPHDYQSIIYFECSEKDEQPQIVNKSDCLFEFKWKTSAACPILKETKTDAKCVFEDYMASQKIHLNSLKQEHRHLKLNLSGTIYVFDICDSYKEKCSSEEGCIYAPAKKHLLTYGSNKYVEFSINKSCNTPTEFNRTLMELECDPIQNNDHYSPPKIADCMLRYKLSTHHACEKKESSFYLYDISDDNHKNNKDSDDIVSKNCYINNPRTSYSFSLNNLKLNLHTDKCPTHRFNYTKNLTEVIYNTGITCENEDGKNIIYRYTILLICSDRYSQNVQNTLCQEIHSYEMAEYCKLLEDHPLYNNSTKWWIITGIVFLIIIGIVVLTILLKCKQRRNSYLGIHHLYNKDADL